MNCLFSYQYYTYLQSINHTAHLRLLASIVTQALYTAGLQVFLYAADSL